MEELLKIENDLFIQKIQSMIDKQKGIYKELVEIIENLGQKVVYYEQLTEKHNLPKYAA